MSDVHDADAALGSIERSIGPQPRALTMGVAVAAALATLGAAGIGATRFLGLPDGRIAMETIGVLVVSMTLLLAAGLVLSATVRARRDRLELRAHGLVRRSASVGTKRLRYEEIERLERGTGPERVDVHGRDGSFLRLTGWEIEPSALVEEIERRRRT